VGSPDSLTPIETQGIKANGCKVFSVRLTGQEVYRLLSLLESDALSAQAYVACRQAVYFAESIREQVHKQGF
jgi:hypothetical protein